MRRVIGIDSHRTFGEVAIANPLQVKAIADAHVKTDKIDAGTLASLHAAGYLPEIWTPDAVTERTRRLAARRFQVVRHRARIKNEVHAILHAYLIPRCPHADLFSGVGRAWLLRQPVPADERGAIEQHIRELDRLTDDLAALNKEIAAGALDDAAIARLLPHHGLQIDRGSGDRGGNRKHQSLLEPAEAGELLRSQPAGASIRAWCGPPRTDL